MALFKKKYEVERDENGAVVAVGRKQFNFLDQDGNTVYVYEIYCKNSWISTNPTLFNENVIGLGSTAVCTEDWGAYLFNDPGWTQG